MSEISITRQSVASANSQSPVGVGIMDEAQQGSRRNIAVKTSSDASDISKIQEEIGNSVSKLADKKTLGQRTIRQGQGASMEALKRITAYQEKLPDMPKEAELQTLVKNLQSFEDLMDKESPGGSNITVDDILAVLKDFDPDVTHQYEALQVAERFFEESGASPQMLALLSGAQQAFSEDGIQRDVQAGYAAAKLANENADGLETTSADIRSSYRTMLQESPNMGHLFSQMKGFEPSELFDGVVDMFMQIAAVDLAATNSSTDPVHLAALTKELGNLKELKTVFVEVGVMIEQTARLDPKFVPAINQLSASDAEAATSGQVEITDRLMTFSSKAAVGQNDTSQLMNGMDVLPPATQVNYATGLLNLHRQISDRSFVSDNARVQQGQALTNLVSNLTIIEEQAYMNG